MTGPTSSPIKQIRDSMETTHVGWNGIRLTVPSSWALHISGHAHLIFEKDFLPLLEIRWQIPDTGRTATPQSMFRKLQKQNCNIVKKQLQEELFLLQENYHIFCYGKKDTIGPEGGILSCRTCGKLIFFHLNQVGKNLSAPLTALSSLSCHSPRKGPVLWSFLGSDLLLPISFVLQKFSFKPGFSCLSFKMKKLDLHCSRLSPADIRLKKRSLPEILAALSGLSENEIAGSRSPLSVEGYRYPSMRHQVFSRLKRQKPFIRGSIQYNPENNILFSMVAESTEPIPPEICMPNRPEYETVSN